MAKQNPDRKESKKYKGSKEGKPTVKKTIGKPDKRSNSGGGTDHTGPREKQK